MHGLKPLSAEQKDKIAWLPPLAPLVPFTTVSGRRKNPLLLGVE